MAGLQPEFDLADDNTLPTAASGHWARLGSTDHDEAAHPSPSLQITVSNMGRSPRHVHRSGNIRNFLMLTPTAAKDSCQRRSGWYNGLRGISLDPLSCAPHHLRKPVADRAGRLPGGRCTP